MADAEREVASLGRELVDALLGFVRLLRTAGVPCTPSHAERFVRGVAVLDPVDLRDVYWAGRSLLVSRRVHVPVYDRLFSSYFLSGGATTDVVDSRSREEPETELIDAEVTTRDEDRVDDREHAVGAAASDVERLRTKDFALWSAEELSRLEEAFASWHLVPPQRRTRRMRAAPRGRRVDVRRWLREAAVRPHRAHLRARRRRTVRTRRVVLLLDVSGSMSSYARALLLFAAWLRRQWGPVEVFCFSTRLTRVTPSLEHRDPRRIVSDAVGRVPDWGGGTRLGPVLRDFTRRYGRLGSVRGSLVILVSDGLERGDPELLGREAARVGRLAHQLIWVNPLKGDPQFRPEARGIAAVLPSVDHFLSGRDLAGLEALQDVLGNPEQAA
ncbi:VWA domain-containing protein [Egibacter rhizosphaerae]|uniref:VWA domain-containing protein n=1 Tax=Egibacter rhizosphaerae TaxID=1670831 RepID=A0A411YBC1_9ACTN|nr:VWA domain-containing protein [Egibacter rhizosphaerae]QBI18521.1 VWA domain-containing protein [Egibacter rhizosphaerae]